MSLDQIEGMEARIEQWERRWEALRYRVDYQRRELQRIDRKLGEATDTWEGLRDKEEQIAQFAEDRRPEARAGIMVAKVNTQRGFLASVLESLEDMVNGMASGRTAEATEDAAHGTTP